MEESHPGKPVILAMDSNSQNLELLSRQLEHEGFEVRPVSTTTECYRAIKAGDGISVAVIDLSGFDRSIWRCCDRLRKAGIPFLLIASQRSPAVQRDSMKHGASSVLVKPVGVKQLIEYIHAVLH